MDAKGMDISHEGARARNSAPCREIVGKCVLREWMDGGTDGGFVVVFGEISSGSSTAYCIDSCEHMNSFLFPHVQSGNFVACAGAGCSRLWL